MQQTMVLLCIAVAMATAGYCGMAGTASDPITLSQTVSAVMLKFSKALPPTKLGTDKDLSGAEIEIVYPELRSSTGKDPAIDVINSAIVKNLLTEEDKPVATSIDQLMDKFTTEYETAHQANPDMVGRWSRNYETRVRCADDHLLSLETHDFLFTGGAHSNTSIRYQVFSMKTGEAVTLAAIVPPANMPALTRIAEGYFRKVRGMKPEQSFEDAGFTFDKNEFALNDNFLVSKDGLAFLFNAYEVAPYWLDSTALIIPWSDLKDLVEPKGIAGHFLTP